MSEPEAPSNLVAPSWPAAPAAEPVYQEPQHQYLEPAPAREQPLSVAPTPSDDFTYAEPVEEAEPEVPALQYSYAQPSVSDEAPADGQHELVSGRVTLMIAPVPDFDRLLSIDGALGRMPDVRNVSLADYAREQVTFRIEVDRPVTAEDFARDLSEASSMVIGVVASEAGNLSLRLS
jgi:hypothetical protein